MNQVNVDDHRIVVMTSSHANEAVIKIKHSYEGDCSINNDEFIKHLSLILGTKIDSSHLLNVRDGFAWIKTDCSSLPEEEQNTISIPDFVSLEQDTIYGVSGADSLSQDIDGQDTIFGGSGSDTIKFVTPLSMLESNINIIDEAEQKLLKPINTTQEEEAIQLHQMNEKILSSIDNYQNQTKRNRHEIDRLDNEIERILESINH